MFDDLDDDDVTDLIPDSDTEKKEKERRREQEQRGRRMTVSEVCTYKFARTKTVTFWFFKDSELTIEYKLQCDVLWTFFIHMYNEGF